MALSPSVLAAAVQGDDEYTPADEAYDPKKQKGTRRISQPPSPRLRLRGRGFLALIRDRECRQPFRLRLPSVPLLTGVVEHRFEIE